MSDGAARGRPGAVPSPSESAAFGFSVGRLTYERAGDWGAADIDADLAASDVDLVILRYPTERLDVAERVLASGRPSIMADTMMHFRWEPLAYEDTHGMVMDRLGPADASLLDALIADIFPGYRNHYGSNPMTRHVDLVAGYQDWARTFLDHPTRRAFVLRTPDDDEAGMCVVEQEGDHLESILAGVRPRARGRGGYQDVLKCQANWAVQNGQRSMGILTQVWNTGAMRAMIRVGFLPEYALSTLHVMRSPARP